MPKEEDRRTGIGQRWLAAKSQNYFTRFDMEYVPDYDEVRQRK